MAAPFKKAVKILLEKDCEFRIGIRPGRVVEVRSEGYLVFWSEWVDPDIGEAHKSDFGMISFDDVVKENKYGKLKILKRPLAKPIDCKTVRHSERVLIEIARMRFRQQFVLAIQAMVDKGELKVTRDDFCKNVIKIISNGTQKYSEYLAAKSMREPKRGGARVIKSKVECEQAIEFHQGFKNGQTFWKWYGQWLVGGNDALFDKYRNCGKYPRYDDETEAFVCRVLDVLWDEERPKIKTFVESVQSAIQSENDRRERLPIPAPKLPKVGYDYILGLIKEHAPIDHAIRRDGWEKAYKNMHALGMGVETYRALERVEVDEYTVDLFVIMESTGLFDHLPPAVKAIIGLNGSPCRVTLSAAIDVHTRCLLALQIVPKAIESPLRHTLEMIYLDKSAIADAAGAKFGWPMAGAPEAIVFDRGTAYITEDAYDILASLGITNLGAPAGKPWLKPFIERVFRTIHSDLLVRFSGRAFSNVVERGDNDSAARATLTLEAFLGWLVRWTVDAYHTKPHTALGMSPAQAWAKATKECTPRSLTSDEMREVFGERTKRKLGRKGIQVNHVHYQNDASIAMYYRPGITDVEVLWWHGDIGTISIRPDDGPWTTVSAADDMWIGKTETDLQVWLNNRVEFREDEALARRNFLNDVTSESHRLKKLAGLVSLPKSAADLEYDVKRFSRFTDTAERRHEFGEYRDVLSDLDDVSENEADQQITTEPNRPAIGWEISDEDSME
jgi:hypothetical protein